MDLNSILVTSKTVYYTEHARFSRVSLVIWVIDDYTKRKPLGPLKLIINGLYLFSWEEVPGKDSSKLIELLEKNFGIDWVQPDNITKDNLTINISEGENNLSLKLDKERKKVALQIKNYEVDEFIVKENDKLGIYKELKICPVKNLSGYYVFSDLPGRIYSVSIESDYYISDEKIVDASRLNNPEVLIKFETIGPSRKETSVKLTDVSRLMIGDVVEFRNPAGKIEHKSISSIDTASRTISWKDKLKNDYSIEDSTISLLKYLPVEISLKPGPSYPFPDNATLVRGYVSNEVPVDKAAVKVIDEDITTVTNENGEFVLYFNDITLEKKISINIEKGISVSVPEKKLMINGTRYLGRIDFP